MNFNRRHFVAAAVATTAGVSSGLFAQTRALDNRAPFPEELAPTTPAAPRTANMPPLFPEARAALDRHASRLAARDRIGLIDFATHSSERRFQIVNVESGQVEQEWLCAHGKGSDPAHTGYLQSFSNQHGSNATSRGAYATANVYYGKYGRSQRLMGLDPQNDQALDRAIVMHGADYVDESLIQAQGRIGRSYGCFAFQRDVIGPVMDVLGEGRMLYAGKSA